MKESRLRFLYHAIGRALLNRPKYFDVETNMDLSQLEKEFNDELDKVEKEKEILEILKKHDMVRYIEWWGLSKPELNLIKEWLEK